MIFDTSIPGLSYAPDEDPEQEDEYLDEDQDMEKYYEEKEVSTLTD